MCKIEIQYKNEIVDTFSTEKDYSYFDLDRPWVTFQYLDEDGKTCYAHIDKIAIRSIFVKNA
jgi:hypothetical protein